MMDDGKLAAIANPDDAVWEPGEVLSAVCAKGKRHPVPFMNCTCGFYATKTYDKLVENGYHLSGVWGTVSMWGKSIDWTEGYKSQFAYPRELWVPYTMLQAVEALAVYGVPVRLANPYTFNPGEHLNGNRQAGT